jgi:hypothetical protein
MNNAADTRVVLLLVSIAATIAWFRGRQSPAEVDWIDAIALLNRLPERTVTPVTL